MKRITYLLICVISLIGGGCTNLLETNSELLGNVVTKVERLDTLEVTLEVAGTLAEKIGDKKDVISKLIVSGPFDADDVTTMKALPKLQSIDMKGVIIVGGDKTYNSWYKLEDNVIGKFMFGNLSSFLLEELILPTTIIAIDDEAFRGMYNLKSLDIPDGVNVIGTCAFASCSGLESITLPSKLKVIEAETFQDCAKLSFILLPEKLIAIKQYAFYNCFKLHSIFWNTSAVFPNVYSYNVGGNRAEGGNMNCLLYLADENTQIDDKEWKNIIINGEADQIVLSSVRPYPFNTTGNFYCPQAFKALKISYSRNFSSLTYPNEPAGWESISLPFTPTQIKHEDGRVLAPFNSGNDNTKPFWLRRLTANGFENVTSFEANVPYIIAMPNNEKYAAEYNIAGTVIFSAENATNGILIPATTDLSKEEGPSFRFCSNYERIPKNAATYVLHKDYDSHKTGSMFVRSERDALPFEAYVATKNISAKAPAMFSVNSSVNTRSNRTIGGKPDIDDM